MWAERIWSVIEITLADIWAETGVLIGGTTLTGAVIYVAALQGLRWLTKRRGKPVGAPDVLMAGLLAIFLGSGAVLAWVVWQQTRTSDTASRPVFITGIEITNRGNGELMVALGKMAQTSTLGVYLDYGSTAVGSQSYPPKPDNRIQIDEIKDKVAGQTVSIVVLKQQMTKAGCLCWGGTDVSLPDTDHEVPVYARLAIMDEKNLKSSQYYYFKIMWPQRTGSSGYLPFVVSPEPEQGWVSAWETASP